MEWPSGDPYRYHVIAALLRDIIIKMARIQGDRDEIRLLRFDDFTDIEEFVVPSVQRSKFEVGGLHDSGTTPLVIAETSFWRSGAKGMRL
jgi:hypothetical protein